MGLFEIDLGLRGFGPQLLEGAAVSLQVWVCSLILGTAFGLIAALLRLDGRAVPRHLTAGYVNVMRGIPDLLVILLLYYCGSVTVSWLAGRYVEINAFAAGVLALALVFGGYAAEIFRGAILAVPPGQREAAQALGLGPARTFALVILPQAWRFALPAYGSQCIILVKQTSLISIIGLDELMRKGKIAVNATSAPFTFYMAVGAIYLAITLALTLILRQAERSAARGHARG